MQNYSKPTRGFNPWPISIIAFFTVAIIGCGRFIAFCSRHPADLVAPDYYEQEVRYQGQIDRIQHADRRAQLASVTYDVTSRRITISLPPNQPRADTTGSIQLYRPSAANLDRHFNLEPNGKGVQTIDASTLMPGLWKVRVSWATGDQEYFVDQQLVIPATAQYHHPSRSADA